MWGGGAFNDAGQNVFKSGLSVGTGDVTSANDEGIWSNASGSLSLLARKGSAAPGTAGGLYHSFNGSPAMNNSGQVAFSSFLLPGTGDVTSANSRGIWSEGSGSLSLVVREGSAAPGTASAVFGNLPASPVINSAGQIAFRGELTGPGVTPDNDEGIWSEALGALGLIAREGDTAPGTDGVFRSFNLLATKPVLNGSGQTAFLGHLVAGTGGVTLANDRGVWATDINGQLQLIVREGDLFDVNDDPLIDDFRTIRTVALGLSGTGGEDGRGTPFNDAGQIAFRLTFTSDGSSGIFVASIDTIAGDLDGDGFVGIEDLNIILGNWNQTVSGAALSQSILSNGSLAGDLDGDGLVGIGDLNVVLSNWNNGVLSTNDAAVPEPAAIALLGAGVLTWLLRR